MKKISLIVFLFIGAFTMIIMSNHYFLFDNAGILKRKEITNQLWYLFIFRAHILFGLLAITIGPTQFIRRIRNSYPTLHKKLGYFYVISVILSSLSGLIIAQFAMGGMITTIGFTVLSIIWLLCTVKAIIAIRYGDFNNHRKWMFYSYALTFSAITQRTLLLVPLLTTISFIPIYQLSSWLPWMINLIIAYTFYKR